jgi:hypothetical protein
VVLLAWELVWVVGANLFLRSDFLERLLNRRPEKLLVQWDSASTWFPGRVSVEGFRVRGQSRKTQWYVAMDDARLHVALLELPFKRFHGRWIRAAGVDVRVRTRIQPGIQFEEGVGLDPEIPGLSNPPVPAPEDLYPPRKKPRGPWTVHVGGVKVNGGIRLALNRATLEGDGLASGALVYRLRRSVEIRRGKLELPSATVVYGSTPLSDDLQVDLAATFAPFHPKEDRGAKMLSFFTGSLRLDGELARVGMLDRMVNDGIEFTGGGRVRGDLQVERGAILAGSSLTVASNLFTVQVMGARIRGTANLDLQVSEEPDEATLGDLVAELRDVEVFLDGREGPVATGPLLRLHSTTREPNLATDTPSRDAIEVPAIHVPDLSAFDAALPGRAGLALLEGRASVDARLEIDETGSAEGRLLLNADGIRAKVRDGEFSADVGVDAILQEGDLVARCFDLSGTRVELLNVVLDGVKSTRKEGWWADVEFVDGWLQLGSPAEVDASVRFEMRDSRPLLAVFAPNQKTPLWVRLLPNVKDLKGEGDVDVLPGLVTVDRLSITGRKTELFGRLRLSADPPVGALFARHGIVAAGVELRDGKTRLHLSKPRKWFLAQPEFD